MSGTQEQQPRGAAGVEDTIKDFWATRPTRPRRGRKIAGVAAGIGNRYGIDPVIIRVAFVVATFYGGAGALFYLLGWLMLPEQDDEAAPLESMVGHGRSSMSGPFTVLLCVALIPVVLMVFDNPFHGFFGLLVIGGALFLLHRSRGHLGRPSAPPPPAPEVAYQPLTEPASNPPAASTEPPVAPSPPAWDPLGAAPFAWDLPEPSPPAPPPAPPRRKSKVGLVTVAVALITTGSLALVAPYAGGWLSPQHIIGIVLGVLGLGMVWGSFVNGGRGLIGWAVPLAVVGVALTVVSPNGWHGVGELVERPATAADVQPRYERSAGRIELDLRELPDEGSVRTAVSVGAGDVEVILPSHADVEVTCQANVGDVNCLGRNESGADSEISVTEGGDSGAGGLHIELDVDAGVGHTEVRRG